MLELGLFWIGIVLIATAIFMLFLDSFQSKRIWAVISLILIVPLFVYIIFNWSLLNIRKFLYFLKRVVQIVDDTQLSGNINRQ